MRRAFTLAEMLIVVGIIAVLAALLLVVTRKGSESARQVQCASNLRQIAAALISYAQDNEGRFPGAGEINWTTKEDWLYWEDPPFTDRPVSKSPIAKYLGKGDPTAILRCPSDEITSRPRMVPPKANRFSYSLNHLFASTRPEALNASKVPFLRLSAIVDPGHKMMVMDEDSESINDASWQPEVGFGTALETYLANRHGKQTADWQQKVTVTPRPDKSDKGNVAFADGHVEFVPRGDTWQPKFYDPRGEFALDPSR